MKHKWLHVLLLLFFSVILCGLYQPSFQPAVLVAGGIVAYAALCLIPRRSIALCAAVLIVIGVSVYNAEALAVAAPAVFAAAASALAGDGAVSWKKDGFYCTVLLMCAVSNVISVGYTLAHRHVERFTPHPFGRYDLFLAAAFLCMGIMLLKTVRTKKTAPKRRGKEKVYDASKRISALAAALCAAAVCTLHFFTKSVNLWSYAWPVFLCAYAALTAPSPAAAAP